MGEGALRCLNCLGKFGPATTELRCNICVTIFRLQSLLVSDHFPADHIDIVYPEIRGAYLKALEVADVQRARTLPGGAEPPRAGDKGLPLVEGKGLQTRSKARPPSPPGERAAGSKEKEKKKREHKERSRDKRNRSRSRKRKKKSPSPTQPNQEEAQIQKS